MCSTVPIRFQTYSGFPEPPVFGVMPVPPEYAVPHPPVLSVPVSFFFWYRSITHPDISVNLPHTALPVQGMTFRNRTLRQFPQSYLVEYPHRYVSGYEHVHFDFNHIRMIHVPSFSYPFRITIFISYYTAKAYCRSHKPQYAIAFMKLFCYTILINHSTVSGE